MIEYPFTEQCESIAPNLHLEGGGEIDTGHCRCELDIGHTGPHYGTFHRNNDGWEEGGGGYWYD